MSTVLARNSSRPARPDRNRCREDSKFLSLFGEAGLVLVRSEMQKGIPVTSPRRLLPVKSYALKPRSGSKGTTEAGKLA